MAEEKDEPAPLTWMQHDRKHRANRWSSSEAGRYALDDYDAEHLFCWRCRRRVLRLDR